MDVSAIQSRLLAAGYDPGVIDGKIGPKTYAALFSYAAKRQLGAIGESLGKGAARHFRAFDITTEKRLAHFIAQGCHETGGFRYFVELGGPSYCAKYDDRSDLGNCKPGDGYRFRGRGIFHLTGRANYRSFGKLTGIDLEAHPEKAADPEVSVLIACHYWRSRDLNIAADHDDCERVSAKINGRNRKTGLPNHLPERQAITDRLKGLLIPDEKD